MNADADAEADSGPSGRSGNSGRPGEASGADRIGDRREHDRGARASGGADDPFDVLVMGAGMSGLCTGIELRRAGRRDFVIVEKSAGLGGTWWDNRYPGAHVDVPAPLYSFSFAPNPHWSRRFAAAPEIQAYMRHCAERYGLAEHLRLGTELLAAAFDEARGLWRLELDAAGRLETVWARFFVCSTGPLSVPRWPDIAGLDTFAGTRLHSARWDDGVPLAGRRVGVIGTGSTASQLVPPIAREAAQLTVFQRTANWVMPRLDRRYGALDRALAHFPPYTKAVRWLWAGVSEWLRRGFVDGTAARRNVLRGAEIHLRRQVRDPALRERLRPPYPFGCKRIIFSNDFYPALARSNVELVTDPIVRVTPAGIVTRSGAGGSEAEREHPLDVLVCATGFDVQHSMPLPVTGRGGASLQALWAEGAMAYLGITVAGFPNLFLMLGPNTGTGHTSTLLYIEAEVRWALAAMDEVRRRGRRWLDVKTEVMGAFNDELQRRLTGSVWSQCRSWYRADNGRIIALWPGYTPEYRRRVAGQRFDDFVFG